MAMFAQNKKKIITQMIPYEGDIQKSGDVGQDFGSFWQDDFSRLPGGHWGGLGVITRTAASVVHENRAATEGKVRDDTRRERGAVLTWTQTHRCAASCCPVGSAAAFCICLGLLSRSRRVAHHSASSWFHLWPRPTLNLMSARSKRRKDEGMTERRRKSKYKKMEKRSKE